MDIESWKEKQKQFDPGGMYEDIMGFPGHLINAKKIAFSASLPDLSADKVSDIVVCGMGGSAIGADLVRSYIADKLTVPFATCRHYTLPSFVSDKSLIIGSSYSGNTEETLSAMSHAARVGAKVICITTGGRLAEMAAENDWTVISIPGGMMPRAALAYSFVPLLVLMSRLGFVPGSADDLDDAADSARQRTETYSIDSPANTAVRLAQRMHGRIPIIYAGPDHFDAVAVRFKGQICENSKQLAFANVFSEFNHNELVGWEIYKPFADRLAVVILIDGDDHPRVSVRMTIVARWLKDRNIEVVELVSDGSNLLSRMISLIQLGDFASFYLAMLNETDPSPVKVIDYLKAELEKV
jgi:glucose/mannose-6-phosphate isomerase